MLILGQPELLLNPHVRFRLIAHISLHKRYDQKLVGPLEFDSEPFKPGLTTARFEVTRCLCPCKSEVCGFDPVVKLPKELALVNHVTAVNVWFHDNPSPNSTIDRLTGFDHAVKRLRANR